MRSLLLAVFAAYLIAAIHSILAFVNKRRSLQRVAEWSIAAGFILHTCALAADWIIDGHYPLFSLREALSFLAWALVALESRVAAISNAPSKSATARMGSPNVATLLICVPPAR